MLNREELTKLINDKKLVENFIDLPTQLTPNGIDITLASVYEFDSQGALDFSSKERKIPACKEILPSKNNPDDQYGWWNLPKGAYKVKTNETVNLPNDLIGLAFTRTSLLRMGVFTEHGVWDAGYKGKAEFMLIVNNPFGVRLKENARIVQLIFTRINETALGYQGIYQNTK